MALNRTFTAGSTVITAADMNGIQSAWSTWSPTYTGITIGNATVVARYQQYGKTIFGDFLMTVGSTTTFSATTLAVSLPVTPHDAGAALGVAMFLDASPVARTIGIAFESSGAASFLTSAGSLVTNTVPQTWAVSDSLRFEFKYEAA